MKIVCFLNIPGEQQHFNVANGKLVYCFCRESIFLGEKIDLKTVSEPFIFKKLRGEDSFYPQTLLLQ